MLILLCVVDVLLVVRCWCVDGVYACCWCSSPDSAPPDSAPSSSVETLSSQLHEPYVWKGYILIQEMLKFVTVAYHVSGPTDHLQEVRHLYFSARYLGVLFLNYLM